jgi:2,4-dienoyl-CoA reductase (NADPH2)
MQHHNHEKKAGYDGVEIMGSEGYLINQFIASCTNKRNDAWGGSYENRIKLALEIVKRCRAEVNPDFVLIFRKIINLSFN